MSEPAKSNSEVLKETPVSTNVNAGEFATETSGQSSTPAPKVEPAPSHIDTSDNSASQKVVDTTNLDTEGFKFDDFKNLMDGIEKPAAPAKVEEPALKEEPKVEPQTTTQVKPSQNTIPTGGRDYSDFDDVEKGVLKKMSNDAFTYVAPKLKELKAIGKVISAKDTEIAQLKTGKQILPDNYFEHPQAFVLTKEFNDTARQLNTAAEIRQHWQQQMINIRKGEPWTDLNDDGKGGLQRVPGKVANVESEMEVMSYLNSSISQEANFQNKVSAIQNSFGERHKVAVDSIKKAEKDYFSVYDDPKHPMQPVIKSVFDALPSEFKKNPLSTILAKAVASAVQFGNLHKAALVEIAELKKGTKVGEGTTNTRAESRQGQAGPTQNNLQANGGGGKQDNTVGNKIEDFAAAME